MKWVEGPKLPGYLSSPQSVNPDESTLLLVGGLDYLAGYYTNNILSFNVDSWAWQTLPGKIKLGDGMAYYGIGATWILDDDQC